MKDSSNIIFKLPPLSFLERFFNLIEKDTLWEQKNEVYYKEMRKAVWNALNQILIWQRPHLEMTKGLKWPYKALKNSTGYFKWYLQNGNSFTRHQSHLFLTLLPFSNQWQRLLTTKSVISQDDEILEYLWIEAKEIMEKLEKRTKHSFHISNFCQILKPFAPDKGKGILRIFSMPYLFLNPNLLNCITHRYFLFIEPPMGVNIRHSWYRRFASINDGCLFGVGSKEDMEFLADQGVKYLTHFAHGEFLNDSKIVGHQSEKKFDIVFNATYDNLPRKRHTLMLDLLNNPLLKKNNCLFLGRGSRKSIAQFKKMIVKSKLEDRTKVVANIPRNLIPSYIAQCKVGVHLSLYENSCRCIYEYFRSNLPCVISSSMGGVNLNIINDKTGFAVPDENLPFIINKVLLTHNSFKPRQWFLRNTGSDISTKGLNEILKKIFINNGWGWDKDIVPLTSSGSYRYANAYDHNKHVDELNRIFRCFQTAKKYSTLASKDYDPMTKIEASRERICTKSLV